MADTFDPDAFLNAKPAGGFDPDAYLAAGKPAPQSAPSLLSRLASPVTDIPHEVYDATAGALKATGHYLNPFSEERRAKYERGESGILDTGKGLASVLSLPAAPIQGAAHSLIGHPLAAADEALRAPAAYLHGEDKVAPAVGYEKAKEAVDTAMMGLAPRSASPAGMRTTPVPAAPAQGPLGVTLSEGQETGALPLIQKEQAALRGQMGDAAQMRAKEFADQQTGQVQAATESVAKELDPYGMRVAETPQEAGQLVSEGIQTAAAQRKAAVTKAYDEAKSLPGEIHADAFRDMGNTIKTELSQAPDPVIIDDRLTPFASHAIKDVEERISKLFIQNKADPLGPPDPNNIVGVDLKGVDQMRKRLSTFRRDAFASGNAADGRAAQAIVKAFDNQVDQAVNGGMFKGDPRAIQAWNDARAAHADYKGTFSAGKNDPVGRVVEKILGKGNNPAAIPNDVANFMYGGSGVNPSSLNVNVAKRVRSILGEQSPEWSAVKQGLFSRLVEAGPGATDWGPGKIAQRVNKFLNADGLELSKEVFSPQERRLIQQYADLQRKIHVPQAGANWSNTSTILAPMLKKISGGIAGLLGAAVGHVVAPGAYGVGEFVGSQATSKISSAFSNARELRKISAQMPLVSEQIAQWQKAAAVANRLNTPLTQRTMNVASANLAQSLQNIGLNPVALLRQSQGPVPSRADQQQQH